MERKITRKLLEAAEKAAIYPSAIMVKVVLTIIVIELLVMLSLSTLPLSHLSKYEMAFLDAALLSLFIAPVLYFFLLLPFQRATSSEQRIRSSMHNLLTGLPKRELFHELVEQEIGRVRRHPFRAALLLIDPHCLTDVNETFGYKVGDELLSELAERIESTLGESDIISIFNGYKFALLLACVDIETLKKTIARINEVLTKPVTLDDVEIDVVVRVGLSIFPDHAESADDLIRRANMALNKAHRDKVPIVIYDLQDEASSEDRLVHVHRLREAIKSQAFELYYQPQIHLNSGEVAGVEALIRWTEKDGLPPSIFIPIAEQTGLIKKITPWVIQEAVNQCSEWKKMGWHIPISINISSRDLRDASVTSFLGKCVEEKSLPPSMITIEVTENSVMDDQELAIELLSGIRKKGHNVSIDDFGTGYSSLAYIKRLPATELKIDQSFVENILSDKKDEVLVKSTIKLARDLGFQVVVEGVEDEEVLEKLRTLGPDIIQGYHFSRPLNANAFVEWYKQWNLSKGSPSKPN